MKRDTAMTATTDCFKACFAVSVSPSPINLATRTVLPVERATNITIMKLVRILSRPTADMASLLMRPTKTVDTTPTAIKRVCSATAGIDNCMTVFFILHSSIVNIYMTPQ
jgi:hypothetical protein